VRGLGGGGGEGDGVECGAGAVEYGARRNKGTQGKDGVSQGRARRDDGTAREGRLLTKEVEGKPLSKRKEVQLGKELWDYTSCSCCSSKKERRVPVQPHITQLSAESRSDLF
jgi:hypothetical protein